MRLFLVALIACLLLLDQCGFAAAQAQELSCPGILKELYYPTSLQITFTSLNMVGYGKNIFATKPNVPFQYGETATGPPQNQFIVTWMTQNITDSWTLDFFMNYTTPTPQYVLYMTTEIDSTGIPKVQQDSCYTATAQVWIHFQITTRTAPRPPTLSETFGFLLQPGNLLVTALNGNKESVDALVGIVWLVFAVVAINACISFFNLLLGVSKRVES